MMTIASSRPATRLALLTLAIAFCHYNPSAGAAGQLSNPSSVPAADLDPQFIRALLTPLSGMVELPYADPATVENPLEIPELTVKAVVHAAISESIASTAAAQPLLAVDVDLPLSSHGRPVLAPPAIINDLANAPCATEPSLSVPETKSAIAMTSR
jgi:hypothetical protein